MIQKAITLLLAITFFNSPLQAVENALLKDLEGDYPIMIPKYEGVKQLIILNNQWIVVVTSNVDLIKEKLDQVSGGTYSQQSSAINTYWVQAREAATEAKLNKTTSYSLVSATDNKYHSARNPTEVYKWIAPLDLEPHPRFLADFAQYSYLKLPSTLTNGKEYTLTVLGKDKVTFTYDENLTVSRAIEVNQAGYLASATEKYAYLSGYVPGKGDLEFRTDMAFEVINVNGGASVLSGFITLKEANPKFHTAAQEPMLGAKLYQIDLSALNTPGTYFIKVYGTGRSWPFKVGDDPTNNPYNQAFYTATRGMYHQRANTDIEAPYSNWNRDKCEWGDILESKHLPFIFRQPKAPNHYKVFDVNGRSWHDQKGKLDSVAHTSDVAGGWHDAGDFDRRMEHFTNIFDMLYLFEFFGVNKFKDNQLNLPESGNGIPDLLDEVEYGLRIWKASQGPDGGVAGHVETWAHPQYCDKKYRWFFSQRTRWSSLLYASGAAMYARLVKDYSTKKSEEYKASAIAAYVYGINAQNAIKGKDSQGKDTWEYKIPAKKDRGAGANYDITGWGEMWDYSVPYVIAARLQLYLLTGQTGLLGILPTEAGSRTDETSLERMLTAEITSKGRGPYQRETWREFDFSPWLYYGVLHEDLKDKISTTTVKLYENMYLAKADELLLFSESDPYRRSKDRTQYGKMAWGFGHTTNHARALLIARQITTDAAEKEKYLNAALWNTDYMLGGNPMGMSWTTGIGWAYPVAVHHRISRDIDKIDDPVPGLAIFGPSAKNEAHLDKFNFLWAPKDPNREVYHWYVSEGAAPIPLLRRWVAHPLENVKQNEFTVHETMSPGIFVYGYFMSDDWTPNEALKNQQPRPKADLFGYWYLP